ncbi:MAG: transcription antitermination factor NusB [Pirellulales bacterium]
MATMPHRRRAREVAVQAIYLLDLHPEQSPAFVSRFLAGRLHGAALVAFAQSLVDGVVAHREEIDAALDAAAERWRVSRMAATDRAILRIATEELLHTAVPGPVAIDEAIELARRYGSADSPRFVAGVLGRLLADRTGAPAPA